MTNREQDFYRELDAVPELPEQCYSRIERAIHSKQNAARMFFAMAATLVLIILGGASYYGTRQQHSLSSEDRAIVAQELLTINDYFTADTISNQYEYLNSDFIYTNNQEGSNENVSY